MTTINTPTKRTLPLDQITPYWRNPRRIPGDAIKSVRESLERYGYQQPIVVDEHNVIVVGHTRYYAMQQMDIDEVEVYVTNLPEDKVKEYRLVDNRTGELSQWDHDSLVMELREFDDALLQTFFSDVDLEIATLNDAMVTQNDVDKATTKALSVKEAPIIHTTRVECPSCFHSFDVRTDSLPGLSRVDLQQMTLDGAPQ